MMAFHLSLVPHVQLVLEDQFEELGVTEPGGGGFLQAHGQGLGQAREAQLAEGGFDLGHGCGLGWGVAGSGMR